MQFAQHAIFCFDMSQLLTDGATGLRLDSKDAFLQTVLVHINMIMIRLFTEEKYKFVFLVIQIVICESIWLKTDKEKRYFMTRLTIQWIFEHSFLYNRFYLTKILLWRGTKFYFFLVPWILLNRKSTVFTFKLWWTKNNNRAFWFRIFLWETAISGPG